MEKIFLRRGELVREKHLRDLKLKEEKEVPRKPLTLTPEVRAIVYNEFRVIGRAPRLDFVENKIYLNSGIKN